MRPDYCVAISKKCLPSRVDIQTFLEDEGYSLAWLILDDVAVVLTEDEVKFF